MVRLKKRIFLLLHILGLSCLGGAVFFQILVFCDIIKQGYFIAVEGNPAILLFETLLAVYTAIYFLYLYQRFIRFGVKWKRKEGASTEIATKEKQK